jgi:hypothetical protein
MEKIDPAHLPQRPGNRDSPVSVSEATPTSNCNMVSGRPDVADPPSRIETARDPVIIVHPTDPGSLAAWAIGQEGTPGIASSPTHPASATHTEETDREKIA